MPNVFEADGFHIAVLLPPREHGPAHVHVTKAGEEISVNLEPVGLRKDYGMRPANIVKAVRLVEANVKLLVTEWRKYHG
ncbi:MAG: DUF4160 domain-containing protein [Gemmatimonadaceae bacterium]